MEKSWKINVSNWTKIPIETAKAILDEGKDYLSYTISESDKITSKAFSFILICISSIGAMIGISINELNSDLANTNFLYLNVSFVFLLALLTGHFVRVHFPRFFMMTGRRPEEVSEEPIICPSNLSPEQINLSFILNEIENVKSKIDFNYNSIVKRIKLLKIGIVLSCGLFLLYFVFALITLS